MKKILLCALLCSYTSIQSMFVQLPVSRGMQRSYATQPSTYKYEYLTKEYNIMRSTKLSYQEKFHDIENTLTYNPYLSHDEKKALGIFRNLLHFKKSRKKTDEQKDVLFDILHHNDKEMLAIGLAYGLQKYINATDKHHNTPLYVAATHAYVELVPKCIKKGAHVNSLNEHGRTPLIGVVIAICNNHSPEQIEALMRVLEKLQEAQADPFISDNSNKTAQSYIHNILDLLRDERKRTMRNERGDLDVLYQKTAQMLEEWY